MEEEEDESNDESAKSRVNKQNSLSLWHSCVRLGKKMTIAGAAITSAPVVIPPAIVGFAFSVPFGVYLAGLVYTDNVMRALLSSSCQHELVMNQDAQVVAQDAEISPACLYYSNANPEVIEIEHISQDDTNEKYNDDGTCMNTDNNEIYGAQDFENNLSSDSDERSGVDICIFLQSSQDGKCDSELPFSSNTAECGDMISPMHFGNEVRNETGRRDLEVQQASESDNDRNPYAEIHYEEQKKLSELQEHGCGLGIEALGLNEALHKLEERSIHKKDDTKDDDIKGDDILEGIKEVDIKEDIGHSFNVVEPIAEMEESDIRDDFNVVEPIAEMGDSDIREDSIVVEPVAEMEGCDTREDFIVAEPIAQMEESDMGEDSNVVEPIAETEESDMGEDSNAVEPIAETEESDMGEDSNAVEPIAETEESDMGEDSNAVEPIAETEESDMGEDSNAVEPIAETEENNMGEDSNVVEAIAETEESDIRKDSNVVETIAEIGKRDIRELSNVVDPGPEKMESDFREDFNVVKPIAEMEERDIIEDSSVKPVAKMKESDIREEDNSMNEELDTNELNSNTEAYDEEERELHTLQQLQCGSGVEELGSNEALHKMEDTVLAENDGTNSCDNSSFIVLEPPVENEDRDISKDDYSIDKDIKIDDNEFDSMVLNVGPVKEEGALGDDSKTKDEVDSEATEIAVSGNSSTGDSNSEYGSAHDSTLGEIDQSKVDELNEFEIGAPGLDNQTDANKEKVIEENDGRNENESHALPFTADRLIDGNTKMESVLKTDDQIGSGHLHHLVNLDKKGTDELEQENDVASAELELEYDTVLQPNLKEGKINMENNEMGESCPRKVGKDDTGEIDYIELNDAIIFDTEKEEKDNMESTVTSDDHPREIVIDESLQAANIEFKDDINSDTSKEEERPLLAYLETEDEANENIGQNEMTDVNMDRKIKSYGNMSNLNSPTEENLNLEDMEYKVKVDEETNRTSYLFAAVMPKEHRNEIGTLGMEPQELTEDGSLTVKDDKPLEELPTVPEERGVNFEYPDLSSYKFGSENQEKFGQDVEESVEGRLDISMEKTLDEEGSEVVHFHEEAIYSEDTIWEQIHALGTIIGCNAGIHSSLTEELKSLYLLVGVEPPASLDETSDLIEVTEKLEFLKSIIGVK